MEYSYDLEWTGEDGQLYQQTILSTRKWSEAELRAMVMGQVDAPPEPEPEIVFAPEGM